MQKKKNLQKQFLRAYSITGTVLGANKLCDPGAGIWKIKYEPPGDTAACQ